MGVHETWLFYNAQFYRARELPSLAASLCFEVNYKPRKQNVLKTFWVWGFHASVAAIARGLCEMVKWPEKIDKSRKFLLGHGFNILWDQKTLLTVEIAPLSTLPFNGEFLPCVCQKELGHKKCHQLKKYKIVISYFSKILSNLCWYLEIVYRIPLLYCYMLKG